VQRDINRHIALAGFLQGVNVACSDGHIQRNLNIDHEAPPKLTSPADKYESVRQGPYHERGTDCKFVLIIFQSVRDGNFEVYQVDADGSNPMVLQRGISAAANIEFGVGALPCTDIYVASGGALVRFEMGDTAGASVPWH